MQGRYINKEMQWRDAGALRGPNVDGGWGTWCVLENQRTATLTQGGGDPRDEVVRDPAFPVDAGQSRVVDVIKAGFDVQEKGGHLQARPLQGFHVVHEGAVGIVSAQPREGAALVRVNQAP